MDNLENYFHWFVKDNFTIYTLGGNPCYFRFAVCVDNRVIYNTTFEVHVFSKIHDLLLSLDFEEVFSDELAINA